MQHKDLWEQNQPQLPSPKTRFPQEFPGNSSGIPGSNPRVLCHLWLLHLSPFLFFCLKHSPNQFISLNPLPAPASLPKNPGIPHLPLPWEQLLSALSCWNPCRRTPIPRLSHWSSGAKLVQMNTQGVQMAGSINVQSTEQRGSLGDPAAGNNSQFVQEPPRRAQKVTKMPKFRFFNHIVSLQIFFSLKLYISYKNNRLFFCFKPIFFFLEVDGLQAGLSALRASIGHTNISMVSLLVHTWLDQRAISPHVWDIQAADGLFQLQSASAFLQKKKN